MTTPSPEWIAGRLGRGDLVLLSRSDAVALAAVMTSAEYEPGDEMFSKGEIPDQVHVIVSGRVELVAGRGEDRVVVEVLGTGDLFGDIPMFLMSPPSFSARVANTSRIWSIAADDLTSILVQRPRLMDRWLLSTADRMARLQRRIVILLSAGLKAQVAGLLLRRQEGGVVRLSQQVIAELLGSRRSSVNRIRGQLEDEELIERRYGAIHVVDEAGLELVLEGD